MPPAQTPENRNPLSLVLDVASHSGAFVVARALGVGVSSAAATAAESVVQLWRFIAGSALSQRGRICRQSAEAKRDSVGSFGFGFSQISSESEPEKARCRVLLEGGNPWLLWNHFWALCRAAASLMFLLDLRISLTLGIFILRHTAFPRCRQMWLNRNSITILYSHP